MVVEIISTKKTQSFLLAAAQRSAEHKKHPSPQKSSIAII
jgi:hypothetical protein